jgi:hypothetical protein
MGRRAPAVLTPRKHPPSLAKRVSILVPIFCLAPLALNARSVTKPIVAAPASGKAGVVKGLKISSRIVSKPGEKVVVAVKVQNPLQRRIATNVRVAVMERPAMHPESRVARMPFVRQAEDVHVTLAPGESLEKRIAFSKVTMPKRARAKKGKAKKGKAKKLVALSMIPASLFARAHVSPAKTATKKSKAIKSVAKRQVARPVRKAL